MQSPSQRRVPLALLHSFSVAGCMLAVACGSIHLSDGGLNNGLPGDANTQSSDGNNLLGGSGGNGNGTINLRANCKRGMSSGTNIAQKLSPSDITAVAPGISWWYDWGSAPDNANAMAAATSNNVEFVPMVFGGPSINTNAVIAQIPAGAKYLLGFNEPNFQQQGNLTPQQAAALWPQIEAIAHARNLKIVSPAVNYCGGACNETNAVTWMDEFFAACQGCQTDAVAFHAYLCYDSALDSSGFLPAFEKYGKPVWLTEFACLGDKNSLGADPAVLQNQINFMTTSVADLEADPNVQRYAWFIGRSSTASPPIGLLDPNNSGELTDLGKLYVSLPQACDPN